MKKKIQKRNEVLQIFWGGRVNTDSLCIACDFCPWDVRKLGDETVHKDIKKRRNIDTYLWGFQRFKYTAGTFRKDAG